MVGNYTKWQKMSPARKAVTIILNDVQEVGVSESAMRGLENMCDDFVQNPKEWYAGRVVGFLNGIAWTTTSHDTMIKLLKIKTDALYNLCDVVKSK
jgi:hypothetical protein